MIGSEERVTFEELPQVVTLLRNEISELKELLTNAQINSQKEEPETFLNVKQTAKVLNLTEATIYSKVCKRELPFHKQGKQLRFLHSELVDYIKQGRKKTNAEIEAESKAYLSENRKEGKKWN